VRRNVPMNTATLHQQQRDWVERVAPRQPDEPPIVFFDGVCNLCNSSVNFLIKRDRHRRLRFASLQGETAEQLYQQAGPLPEDGQFWSVMLWDERGLCDRSEAALGIARHLGGLWRLATIFRIVPRPIRDAVYEFIARNRYRWFGKKETCRVPTPAERGQMLP